MSRRRILALFAAFATAMAILAVPGAAGAVDDNPATGIVEESPTGSYIVVMDGDPLAAMLGQDNLSGPAAERIRKDKQKKHDKALQEAGAATTDKVNDYTNAVDGFSAILSHEQAEALAARKDVRLVMPDEMRQLTTDSSPAFLGLAKPGEAWQTGLTGEDVIVGVIDSGIWPEHPSFSPNKTVCLDKNGKAKNPKSDGTCPKNTTPTEVDAGYADLTGFPLTGAGCDFGESYPKSVPPRATPNPNDAPFTCNNKLLGARQMLDTYRALIGADPDEFDSARDDDGHGTHTASTAAGNAGVRAEMYGRYVATISGIAPRARIIAYKGLGNLGGFSSDLAAAIDQAVADGVDVINYSVGGGASLLNADDIAYLFAADAGVFVATSAGNSGPGAGTIGGPASVPWITTVGASTQKRFFEGTVMLDKGGIVRGASLTLGTDKLPLVDAEFAGGDLCDPGTLDPDLVAGKIVLCRRGAVDRAAKSLAVFMAGGAGMIMYNNSDADNLFTDSHWVPSVHVDYTDGVKVKDYIASSPNPMATIETFKTTNWKNAPTMTIFSSRGPDPVAEDIIKPDVTAPGLQILAGNSPYPDPDSTPPGALFQAIAGTSMSSPHVAGLFALLKQAHPDWTPAAAKSALMTTAYQAVKDNDRTSPAGPFAMGAGHVDPGKVKDKGSMFNPGLVYDAGFLEYLGFLCDAAPEAFGDPVGTCASLESDGIPTDASDLNLASIGVAQLPGMQTVTRTVTSVADRKVTYNAHVVAPAGYHVVVTPNRFTINPGETVSYTVTIHNMGAPIGEWRFGSLTWKGGGYEAYSPIAVRASLFNAPYEVSGSGTNGSASFDVTFGYTGAYTAAPHGLVADTVIGETVPQDPDQTFDPDDGYSNAHTFDLLGDAFFRVALPPSSVSDPGAIDIDMYLYDPNGDLVASSTAGGTNEQIDILLPMDGTWTLYVHGWQTAGPSAAYELSSWIVSATPGGSLTIDSAPTSATLGATSTINVSWSVPTDPFPYLGAVSHSDASGLIGLTLIDVDAS